jgi:RimJ/RimL family protein N-acetyltransferase
MRLELDHHRIEPLRREHLDAFIGYRQVPRIARYQSWAPTYSHADGEALLAAQSGREFPADGEWVQFGIVDRATATPRSVIAHLFASHGAHRVIATSDERNEAVRRTLTRVGFRHEGTLLEADWLKGEWTTVELQPPQSTGDGH